MDSTGKVLAALAAVLVVAGAGVLILTFDTDPAEVYSIEYELNGGEENSSLNPSEYTAGNTYKLYAATDDVYVFYSWYLDEDLTVACSEITSDMTGDLTLYASWTTSLEGMGFVLSLDGTISDGFLNTTKVSGTENYQYLYYNADNSRYYMEYIYDLSYTSGFHTYNNTGSELYWSDEDSDYTWEMIGTEMISTANGDKECEIWLGTNTSGDTQEQWVGDGWIPYLIEYKTASGKVNITYTYVEDYTFEPNVDNQVVVYADYGLSVTGAGTYNPGDTVELSVTVDSGHSFEGWYDDSGTLLSTSKTYEYSVSGSDVVIYAVNTDDPDVTYESEEVTLEADTQSESLSWSVVDTVTDKVVDTFTGASSMSYTFDSAGSYLLLATDGESFYGFYTVVVYGDVTRTFEWEYNDKEYTYDLTISYADYKYYVDLYDVSERCQGTADHDRTFVTYGDTYIKKIASDFETMTSGFTDLQVANFILMFTQYIEYQADDVYMGVTEYWKFPLETLYGQGGDCEDTSILYCAIAEAMGYETAMLLFTGHMAAGIIVSGCTGTAYHGSGSKMFYYAETTATGYDVGDVPSSIRMLVATVIEVY
ncbi:MAG: InlB B-repeat-containing protein [Candidatus Methanomethylophilaceae archaeon]|jgi:uncharacterized repeat protein (TIGR02543 family)